MAPKKATKAAAATADAPAAAAASAPPSTPIVKPQLEALPPVSAQEAVDLVHALTSTPEEQPTLEQFTQLLSAADANPTNAVPPHVRAKALALVALHGAAQDAALNHTARVLVGILANDDSPVLHVAALGAISAIAPKLKAKQFEFVRDMYDVLITVSLEGSGFAPNARSAAQSAMTALLDTHLGAVVVKLLHLISDERALEEPEHLQRERTFAIDTIQSLVTSPTYGQMTEEVQQGVLKFMGPVLPVVSAPEFTRLVTIALQLPIVKARHGAQLVEIFMAQGFKATQLRSFEALAILGALVPRTAVCDAVGAEIFPLIPVYLTQQSAKPATSTVTPVAFTKALLLAARLASEAACAPVIPVLADAIVNTPVTNYTILEASLLSLSFLGHRNGAVALPVVHNDNFAAKTQALLAQVKATKESVGVALLKLIKKGQATEIHGEAHACLTNVATMLEAYAGKTLPSKVIQTSWDGRKALPKAAAPVAAGNGAYSVKRPRS